MGVKGDTNRQRIIDAASELFYHKGYNLTSFSDIAAAAGLSRGNFYYYFKTKDEILSAVIAQRVRSIRGMLEAWDHQCGGPQERLRRFVGLLDQSQDDIVRYGCPIGSLNMELGKTQGFLQEQARALFDLLRHWLEAQFRELGQSARSQSLALHTLALMQGVSVVGNVYSDPSFLQQEVARIREWADGFASGAAAPPPNPDQTALC